MELAMLRLLSKHLTSATSTSNPHMRSQQEQQVLQALNGRNKIVYIGPIKALVQERQADWQQRFGKLGLRCVQLTGDVDEDNLEDEIERADVICTTPEKFGECALLLAGKRQQLAGGCVQEHGPVDLAAASAKIAGTS
jgi:replicative superfamily II helicase